MDMTEEQKMLFMARINKFGFSNQSERQLYEKIQLERDMRMIGVDVNNEGMGNELIPVGKLGKTAFEVGFEALQSLGLLR